MPSLSQTVDAADWIIWLQGNVTRVLKDKYRNKVTTKTKKGTPIGIV